MKNDGSRQLLVVGAMIVLLLILSQLTRFQTNLVITYNGTNLSAVASQYQYPAFTNVTNATFTNVSIIFRKSMSAEDGMSSFSVSHNDVPVVSQHTFVLYLFGHDVLGTMVHGNYTGFLETFGDWYTDNFRSHEVALYDGTLTPPFTIRAQLLGRGTHLLFLKGNVSYSVTVNDGLIDNTFSLCGANGCSGTDREYISTNSIRILNFFIEGLLLASVIIFIVLLIKKIHRGAA